MEQCTKHFTLGLRYRILLQQCDCFRKVPFLLSKNRIGQTSKIMLSPLKDLLQQSVPALSYCQSISQHWHLALHLICVLENKVITFQGSTPKRESQQQCVSMINTSKPCHAMPNHDIQCNAIQPVQCNPVPYQVTSCPPCHAYIYGYENWIILSSN